MTEALNMLVGQEIFVVASEESFHNVHASQREFHVFDNVEELQEKMGELDVNDADEYRVIHGVLTHAAALPTDLKDRTAFVLVIDEADEENGYMVEAGDTVEHVEDSVKDIIENGIGHLYDAEIEQVFVVYGYELTITLSINEDDLDEEVLDACHRVAEAADSVFDENRAEIEDQSSV